jgi:hypothetical protein
MKRNYTKGKYIRQVEKLHRKRNSPAPPRYNGTGEPEVVPGFQIARWMQPWVEHFVAERPYGQFVHKTIQTGYGNDFIGPIGFLEFHTGINERRIRGIIKGEIQFVPLSDADEILSAAGLSHLLATGEIQVVPNPNWSPEKWLAWMEERGCI